ncbi:MAG: 30S ribosomal protein S4 [Patescibacteria group bacterium]|nr:MAG: 30S ribosomal protein S4 [Patescibacteria group bacterium]
MRYTGSKLKLSRKLGADIGLITPGSKSFERMMNKLNIKPGQHGRKRKRYTEYGLQLLEKQKLRFMFLLNEKQLSAYFDKAVRMEGNTAKLLSQILEKRLDNVVYRLGFAPTRTSARQLVSHKHITVNGKVVNIASYQVKVGDVIGFSNDKIQNVAYIKECLENEDLMVPSWLKREGNKGTVVSEPDESYIEQTVDLRMVVDYYSR